MTHTRSVQCIVMCFTAPVAAQDSEGNAGGVHVADARLLGLTDAADSALNCGAQGRRMCLCFAPLTLKRVYW